MVNKIFNIDIMDRIESIVKDAMNELFFGEDDYLFDYVYDVEVKEDYYGYRQALENDEDIEFDYDDLSKYVYSGLCHIITDFEAWLNEETVLDFIVDILEDDSMYDSMYDTILSARMREKVQEEFYNSL